MRGARSSSVYVAKVETQTAIAHEGRRLDREQKHFISRRLRPAVARIYGLSSRMRVFDSNDYMRWYTNVMSFRRVVLCDALRVHLLDTLAISAQTGPGSGIARELLATSAWRMGEDDEDEVDPDETKCGLIVTGAMIGGIVLSTLLSRIFG